MPLDFLKRFAVQYPQQDVRSIQRTVVQMALALQQPDFWRGVADYVWQDTTRLEALRGSAEAAFLVADDGATGQALTTSLADVAGLWAAPAVQQSQCFTWNGTTGELQANKKGVLHPTLVLHATNSGAAVQQLYAEIQHKPLGGAYATVAHATGQSSNGTAVTVGHVTLPAMPVPVGIGDLIKVRARYANSAGSVGTGAAAGLTRFAARLAY